MYERETVSLIPKIVVMMFVVTLITISIFYNGLGDLTVLSIGHRNAPGDFWSLSSRDSFTIFYGLGG